MVSSGRYTMAYVVDFQAFKSLDNKFIVKEMAILRLDREDCDLHLIFKPPQPFDTLPREMKKRVAFLTRHIHGIPWEIGHNDFKHFLKSNNVLCKANLVFVKGSERVNFIRNLLPNSVQVLDLDNFLYTITCYTDNYCVNHLHSYDRCAYNKAFQYKQWLLQTWSPFF